MDNSSLKSEGENITSASFGKTVSRAQAAKILGIKPQDVEALVKEELINETAPGVFLTSDIAGLTTKKALSVAEEAAQVGVGLQRAIATSLNVARVAFNVAATAAVAYGLVVVGFIVAYSYHPAQVAAWITQKNPTVLQALLQPEGSVALGIVKYTEPAAYKEVAQTTIVNPNDILTVGAGGSITPTGPLVIPTSAYLQILSTAVVKNFNADLLQGKIPGTTLGDIAVIGAIGAPNDGSVSTAKIADSAVTSAKIADGTVANADLAQITDANKVAGSAVQLGSGGGLTNNSGLSLLTGCSDAQVLVWNASNSSWGCSANGASTGAGITAIREGGVDIVNIPTSINFNGTDFAVTESTPGVGDIAIDYLNSGITQKGVNETISGSWSFPGGLTLATQTFGSHTITDSGALAIATTTTGALTLDSGTTGNVNLGTGANAKAISIGNNTAGTTLALTGGTTWSISTAGILSTTGSVNTTGTGTITSAGLLTASNGLTLGAGSINLTGTSGTLALSGLGSSSISTGSNALTITSSNFNTTATGVNSTAIGTDTPSTGKFTSLTSTGTSNIGSGTGAVTLNSSGALNLTGASSSTWTLGANTLTLNSSNFNISSSGVVTVAGGQTQDLTTTAGTNPAALTIRPGNNTTNSGTGALLTISGGNESGTTSTGGNLTLTAGTGTSNNGTINLGTTNTKAITIGAGGITTTNTGALTVSQLLTASNGLTLTTGALNLTASSGALSLTGLTASSINASGYDLNITSNNFNTTHTGINGTVIGATTAAAGTFSTLTGLTFVGSTNTSGNILVANGSQFNSVAMSGGATINSAGALTLNYSSQLANGSQNGFLSSTDWSTFSGKQDALVFTPEDIANKSTDTGLGAATPSNTLYPTQNAVKVYVDNIATGLIWKNPVELINVIADQTLPPGVPVENDGYIINSGGAPATDWGTLGLAAGDLVQYQSGKWVKIKSLALNDWFGVAFKSSTTPSGSLAGKKNNLVKVTGGSAGAWTFTFTPPANNYAVFVENANAYYHDVSYVYSTSLTQWVQLSASASYSFASGLQTVGTTVSLGPLTSDWTQSGAFDINTAGDISVNGGDLKTTAASATLFNAGATTLNIGGAATTIGLGAAGATVTGGGALTMKSGAGTALTLDSGTTGGVNIGNGANVKAIVVGSSTVGTTLALTGGTTWSITGAGALSTTGSVNTTGTGTITSAGLLTASNGLTLTGGAINLTATSGALGLTGLGASSISTGGNALTITSSNFNTTGTGINGTAIGTDTPGAGKFTTLTSTGTSNIGSSTGVVTLNSSGALNITGADASTWTLGAHALTLSSSNFNVSSTGVLTLAGGQAADITTLAGTAPTALIFQPGNNTNNSGTGAAFTLRGGNESGTISTGGNLILTAGTGTSTNGTITIGTTNTSAITIGATGITTTNTGALTTTQTLTASNGLTVTTGAVNLTSSSGALGLTGLTASSINASGYNLTITSSNFNTTSTGINGTAIGTDTASTGKFTSVTDSGLTASSEVFTDASKVLTTTAPVSGVLGYWNRGSSTLSPGTSGDAITTSGTISTSGSGAITSAGLLTGSNGLTLSAGAINLTATSGALGLTGLGASTISTTSNGLTLSTVTSGTLAVTSAGALNLTGAAASTWNLGAHALTLSSSNFNVSSTGQVTLNGGLTIDLTTPAGIAMTIDSGTTGALNFGTQANAKTITIGNNTGATAINITSGTGAQTFTSSLITGTAFVFNATATATGTSQTGLSIQTSADTNIANATKKGLTLTGGAITENTGAATGTDVGIDLTMGALTLTSGTALNSHGLRITTGSITQTAGALTENGLLVDQSASTITTGGTINGLNINSAGVGAGALNGINISSITAGAGTEYAINIGTGWDASLNLQNATPTIRLGATDNTAFLRIVDSAATPNSLLELRDLNTNFGASVSSGAFISRNSSFVEEFNNFRGTNCSATTIKSRGDYGSPSGCTANTGELTLAIVTAGGGSSATAASQNTANGVERLTAIAGASAARTGSILEYLGTATASTPNNIYSAANLPVITMKMMTDVADANHRVFIGIGDDTTATAVMPVNGIFFSNCTASGVCGTNWNGVVNNAGVVTYASCGAVDTAHFAFGRIEVRSTTDVHFFMDTNTSDGIVETQCGTGLVATPSVVMSVMLKANSTSTGSALTTNFDIDYFRSWQDDAIDGIVMNSAPSQIATPEPTPSTLIADTQKEAPPDPIAFIAKKIADGEQVLAEFITAKITAIRGYFDELFANKVHTKEICVQKSDGSEVCVNGDQLDKLLPSPTPIPSGTGQAVTPMPSPSIVPTELASPSSTSSASPVETPIEPASPDASQGGSATPSASPSASPVETGQ